MKEPFMQMTIELATSIMQDCKGNGFMLYSAIFSHFNKKRHDCFPSYKALMDETGLTKPTLVKTLNLLTDKGYIIIKSGKEGKNNNYYFPKEPLCAYTYEERVMFSKVSRRKGTNEKKDTNNISSSSTPVANEVVETKPEQKVNSLPSPKKNNANTSNKKVTYDEPVTITGMSCEEEANLWAKLDEDEINDFWDTVYREREQARSSIL